MQHFGKLDGTPVLVTDHALARCLEMKISGEEIRAILISPEEIYTSPKYKDSFCHRRGEYALALRRDGDTLVVITALYATLSDWLKASRDGKLPEGRDVRIDTGLRRF